MLPAESGPSWCYCSLSLYFPNTAHMSFPSYLPNFSKLFFSCEDKLDGIIPLQVVRFLSVYPWHYHSLTC